MRLRNRILLTKGRDVSNTILFRNGGTIFATIVLELLYIYDVNIISEKDVQMETKKYYKIFQYVHYLYVVQPYYSHLGTCTNVHLVMCTMVHRSISWLPVERCCKLIRILGINRCWVAA